MKITLLQIGKTDEAWIKEATGIYSARLKHYTHFDTAEIPALKLSGKISEEQQKDEEGKLILKRLQPSDYLVLLDEKGKEFSSEKFAAWIGKHQTAGQKHLVFVIGGPFGFSPAVYERANEKIALSQMTFSHQMVRIFFTEQLYRGFTILRGEKYHHS
ncbi:MAG: 23S rRNA (pseudouridine(1915)-N(3))-methyltransferase RlmH [Bacteroidia bacterium]|jgi:23S rRNA (pseudouridine1915-N3)-methyltransferase|nr:23S rRNA (pseudouridine(1915)-N(3))-methyltransferase RlmH [Bacteroidia bacterium]